MRGFAEVSLTLTSDQHEQLRAHLFPGDGKEAVAVALCGRRQSADRCRLLVHEIVPIPHELCERNVHSVKWKTEALVGVLPKAEQRGLSILKVHSHPGGYSRFSPTDAEGDTRLFDSLESWIEGGPNVSAVMVPDGRMFGRAFFPGGFTVPVSLVTKIGDDIDLWQSALLEENVPPDPEFALRHIQVFGQKTFRELSRLRIAVVGCSGTGSPVVEQLARLGVGRLVLVDSDIVEEKNLNRMLNATEADVRERAHKVDVLRRAVERMGLGTEVLAFRNDLASPDAVRAVADCDAVFGCLDTVDGRNLLNRLATFYLLPYFDVGVRLEADGKGGVSQVSGVVHYLRPGGDTLRDRGVYDGADLEAAALRHSDPKEYERRVGEGYIKRIREDRPAVVSINMVFAGLAVTELVARIHPFKDDANVNYASYAASLSAGNIYTEQESSASAMWRRYLGRGDMNPLLDMPELSARPATP